MILLDTNILARILQPASPHHQPAVDAIVRLHGQGQSLNICPQNIVELYAIATRDTNGLALTPEEALIELAALKSRFSVLADLPSHAKWEELIVKYRCTNKRVYDLRLVAAALVGGCAAILTFNDADFLRFTEIQILHPCDLLKIPRV